MTHRSPGGVLSRRLFHVLVPAALVLLAAGAGRPSASPKPPAGASKPAAATKRTDPPKPTTAPAAAAGPQQQLQKLLADYRNPKLSAEERGKVVEQVLALGEEGARRLIDPLGRDFKTKRAAYLKRYEKAAGDALRANLQGKANLNKEVAALRQAVLGVGGEPNLQEEMIVERADPALKQLEELTSVKPDAVPAADPELKPLRDEVLALAGWWQQAAAKLPEAARKKLPPASAVPDPQQVEAELTANEELAATFAMPMQPKDRVVMLANVNEAKKIDPEAAKGILKLNLLRVRLGLGALAIDPKLCEASKAHSKDMVEFKFFDHESPVPGRETPWKRAAQAGTTASAENIFEGSESGEEAVRAWWHSPGHHKNLVGPHRRVGMGRHQGSWTQLFGQ